MITYLKRGFDRLFRRDKIKREQMMAAAEDYGNATGLHMREQEPATIKAGERLLICLLKGIVMGAVISGTIGCFASACSLPCNMPMVCFVVFSVAIICSLLYYSQVMYNIGLILMFILFCYCVLRFFGAFNSGFSAIINILSDYMDEQMGLEGLRQFTESITNRYYTITMCLSLIGAVGALVMNSVFNGFQRFSIFLAGTGFLLCVCFFLELFPGVFWLCVMIWGYTMAIVLCMSNHMRMPGKHGRIQLSVKKSRKEHKKNYIYLHQNNGKGILHNGLFFAAVYCCIGLFLLGFNVGNNGGGSIVRPAVKKTTVRHMLDDFVRDAYVNGILGFFNEYDTNGGVNSGLLGGVRSVNLDFQTDLIVDYVPYTTDRVYLKMFSGELYEGNRWVTENGNILAMDGNFHWEDMDNNREEQIQELLSFVNKESLQLQSYMEMGAPADTATGGVFGSKMRIEVVERSVKGAYRPYYTLVEEEADYLAAKPSDDFERFTLDIKGDYFLGNSPVEPYELYYYGIAGSMTSKELISYQTEELKVLTESYEEDYLNERDYIQSNLYVPEELQETLEQFCVENDIRGSKEEVIDALIRCFSEDFSYTYSPGKTPKKEDFVTYFLKTQKKGYCVYFASAAVLLLRQNGIPARYCEGYCIDYEDILEGDILTEEDYGEWFEGYNELGETAVVRLELSDASAHAWVEIYEEGFGWVPYEFTVADMEEGEYAGFWSQFSQLLGQTGNSDNGNQNNGNQNQDGTDLTEVSQQALGMMKRVLLGLVAAVFAVCVILFIIRKLILHLRLYYIGSFQDRLEYQYHMINLLAWSFAPGRREAERRYSNHHGETTDCLIDTYGMQEEAEELKNWSRMIVRMSYSPFVPDREQYETCTRIYRKARKGIYRGQNSLLRKLGVAMAEGVMLR